MPMQYFKHKILIASGLVCLLLIGVSIAMPSLDIKLPLSGVWKERFIDVKKLNDYAKNNSIKITNVIIENHNIDGVIINNGRIENADWKDVSVKNTNLTKLLFSKGIIEDVDFSGSILTEVVFEDVKLRGVSFINTTLNNVQFIRCTFNGVGIDNTKASNIEVIDSKAISSSFSRGELNAVFRNTKLSEGVRLTSLQPPSSLTFEKSELDAVDMGRSNLEKLILTNSKSLASHIRIGVVDKVIINNSDIDIGFSESTFNNLEINKSKIKRLMLNYVNIKKIALNDCDRIGFLGMADATIGTFNSSNCSYNEFMPLKASIETLHINDGAITNSDFSGMKANNVVFDNVILDGDINFTGAKIKNLETKNITKQPGLKLITTGSNVKL